MVIHELDLDGLVVFEGCLFLFRFSIFLFNLHKVLFLQLIINLVYHF
jgi:hypothetical protein